MDVSNIEVRTPLQTLFSKFVRRLLPVRVAGPMLFLLAGPKSRLMRAYGYAKSLKRMVPLDDNDQPLPWLVYGLSSFLTERLSPSARVLEFGGGYSTLYFMGRAARVVAIEHDHVWAARLRGLVNERVLIVSADGDKPSSYCSPVGLPREEFDLILIDGIHRLKCLDMAFGSLSLQGVIVLDDSDRLQYASAMDVAAAHGFKYLHFEGHKPGSIGLHRSTVFYRDENCLGI